jgi:hypothetical protein
MGDQKQITIWIDEEQRERWSDYADELGYNSRAELVRRSVEHFYAHETSSDDGDILERLDEIEQYLQRLQNLTQSLENNTLSPDHISELTDELVYKMEEEFEMPEEETEKEK